MKDHNLEEQQKIAFRRIYDKIMTVLDGEEPSVAFATILSLACLTGYESGLNVPQMKEQLQHFLKTYAEFVQRRLTSEKK